MRLTTAIPKYTKQISGKVAKIIYNREWESLIENVLRLIIGYPSMVEKFGSLLSRSSIAIVLRSYDCDLASLTFHYIKSLCASRFNLLHLPPLQVEQEGSSCFLWLKAHVVINWWRVIYTRKTSELSHIHCMSARWENDDSTSAIEPVRSSLANSHLNQGS